MFFKKYLTFVFLSLLQIACTQTAVIPNTETIDYSYLEHQSPSKLKKTPLPIQKNKVKAIPALTQLPNEVVALLRARNISQKGMSVYIHALSAASPLLTFNADIPRNPASVMKLITTYAALGILGSDYRWPIELYHTGQITNGVLQGNLILKGYGYPNFKPQDLRLLLKGLRKRGVKKITGDLILDNTYFARNMQTAGDFDGKSHARYNALPDALLYNERISEFLVKPQKHSASIISLHPAKNVRIVNKIKMKNVKCSGRYANPAMRIRSKANQIRVQFDGLFSSRCGSRKYTTVISNPVNMLYASFRKIWTTEMDGTIVGNQLIIAKTPQNAQLLYRLKTKSVKEILPLINKKSNNVMARQLFLSIAARAGLPATLKKGARKIKQWYTSRGLNFSELQIENGSGLSRQGKVSARHIGELLTDAYNSPNRTYLLNSLPIMGIDGTLKRRMRGSIAANRSYMKTGTLRNARGIAGYVKTQKGQVYVVVILHNGSRVKRSVLAAHNKLIEWTAQQTL
jgi:D-alanyl-D-alanine carboxypeptidase/D-alanyl-D-alanine-endopeptidase (penicillin-binding protein 4)